MLPSLLIAWARLASPPRSGRARMPLAASQAKACAWRWLLVKAKPTIVPASLMPLASADGNPGRLPSGLIRPCASQRTATQPRRVSYQPADTRSALMSLDCPENAFAGIGNAVAVYAAAAGPAANARTRAMQGIHVDRNDGRVRMVSPVEGWTGTWIPSRWMPVHRGALAHNRRWGRPSLEPIGNRRW